MSDLLSVQSLTGGYSYHQPVIHQLSFDIQPGEMVGLVGLNGAGKSTTIKHILGLMEAHQGSIAVNGHTIHDDIETYRSHIGFVPESPDLYDQLTLREHLELSAMAYKIDKDVYEKRMGDLTRMFSMEGRLDWYPGRFSKGMKQKVMIMCAFLVRPDLYIVDEPFVGLDPVGIQSFLDFMMAMRKEGSGILMSTHILSTAEQYCDRFIILHNGQIAAQGDMETLRSTLKQPKASLHDMYISIARGETPWDQ
ncbi:ABC transporter ATP-binding protein [Tuberibacillus sp. Marseille-P3662]|uniref:ABC transporter ATP-binding protein n=1 Tax=Tuberibacillus sp. Marseille-P3662 TaxID=1965358 RepID=UPI000A1C9246|nr:ABC transporter ATP-binding protein [Tuberibacillus sp. Marseille-P3662]